MSLSRMSWTAVRVKAFIHRVHQGQWPHGTLPKVRYMLERAFGHHRWKVERMRKNRYTARLLNEDAFDIAAEMDGEFESWREGDRVFGWNQQQIDPGAERNDGGEGKQQQFCDVLHTNGKGETVANRSVATSRKTKRISFTCRLRTCRRAFFSSGWLQLPKPLRWRRPQRRRSLARCRIGR